MKKTLHIFVFLCLSFAATAETVYVTDRLDITLRSQENNRSKILKMLPAGTPLTVIEKKPSGYTEVRLNNGIQGYILTRHTLNHPTHSWYLKKAEKELEELRIENARVTEEISLLKGDHSKNSSENLSLIDERNHLRQELNSLRQTSAQAVQIKLQRDELKERVINVERELQQTKLEKQALEDSTNQDWFLYGGILAFAGIFLGLLIPKIGWNRKTSNWDSF